MGDTMLWNGMVMAWKHGLVPRAVESNIGEDRCQSDPKFAAVDNKA